MVRNFIVGIGKYREKKFIAPDIVFSRGEANGYLYKKSSLDQFLKKVGVTSLDVGGLMTSKQLAVAFGRDHNTTGRYLKKYKKELPTPETSFGKVAGKGIGITNYYPKETVSKLTALLRRDEIEIKNRKPITVNKVRYRSIQKACEILGLNYAVVGKRLREGASTRKAFKEAYQK